MKLHMLRIRFGGFSVLKITKGLKASWVDKLAHLGGTSGLLTGVSYITLFEVLRAIIVSCMLPCKSKENKVKRSRDMEANQSKEDENTIVDLKKRFDAMEKKMIIHDYTMIEDQSFEAYKKEVDTLKEKIDGMQDLNKRIDAIDGLMNKMDTKVNKMMKIMEKLMAVVQ